MMDDKNLKWVVRTLLLSIILSSIIPFPCFAADVPAPLYQLTYAQAEDAVGKALADVGAGNKIAATIIGRKTSALYESAQPVSIEIRGLQFNKQTSHWSANLLAVAGGQVVTALPISGRFEETVEMPVLKRQMRSGEVISQADIEVRDFPLAQTRAECVHELDELIGKSPMHSISPGRPVRAGELENPAVVHKNALVQMRYLSPGMEITATGQAMDEGAKGDVISVRNTDTKHIVRATVEDANTVNVTALGEGYAAN